MKDDRCCNFCGKSADEVQKLIAGPMVFICDECISLCVGIINASDGEYLLRIRHEIRKDKQMRQAGRTAVEAPDDFWNLLDQDEVYTRMARSILTGDIDLNDNLSERAFTLMNKARVASSAAWKLFHDKYPEHEGKQARASHGHRVIYVED